MPYLVSSIIAIVAATIILLTRYEADDSSITAELDSMKSMFSMVDGFVNTYVQSGGDLTKVNFEELYNAGILPTNMAVSPVADANAATGQKATTSTFPNNTVVWQLIPNKNDSSSYKILIDMTKNISLKSRAAFSESFSGREFCEKMLFGTFQTKGKTFVPTFGAEDFNQDGTNNDGLFVCIVFK